MIEAQQFRQPPRVDLVTLVAFPHGGILSRIAHHQFRHARLQQVVQPGGPGSFFKRHLQVSAQPIDKLQNHAGFRLDHAFPHDLSCTIPHRNRNAFLVDIHTDILFAIHRGRSFLVGIVLPPKPYSKRGALLYCVPRSPAGMWPTTEALECLCIRSEGAILNYIGGQRPKMWKNILMTPVLIAAMMSTAHAAKQTAFCPYDGEIAQWTGSQKGAYPNQVCEYKHFFFDTKTKQSVKHVFWHACDS